MEDNLILAKKLGVNKSYIQQHMYVHMCRVMSSKGATYLCAIFVVLVMSLFNLTCHEFIQPIYIIIRLMLNGLTPSHQSGVFVFTGTLIYAAELGVGSTVTTCWPSCSKAPYFACT